ncbi:unnamed protein product [Amoebophrya sp. A25]|nr:unnamed protein product [Amoebophrya sp. A25]|eukprot:GSA25T00026287001.1
MVLPFPNLYIAPVPSDYALRCRPWFWSFSFILLLEGLLKTFGVGLPLQRPDVAGGFMTVVIAGVGIYTLRDKSIDMQCLLSWGVMCLINGILSGILLVDSTVKGRAGPLFVHSKEELHGFTSKPNVIIHNFASVVRIAAVLAMLFTATLVFKVYSTVMDAIDALGEDSSDEIATQRLVTETAARIAPTSGRSPGRGCTFIPFEGQGKRLPTNDSSADEGTGPTKITGANISGDAEDEGVEVKLVNKPASKVV